MAKISFGAIQKVQNYVEENAENFKYLEELAHGITNVLHNELKEFNVLSRIFVNLPYKSLPKTNKQAVDALTDSLNVSSKIKRNTQILSLVGSSGAQAQWNDRSNSQGHVGIPLISTEFIDGIPMMARLLGDLGIDIEGMDEAKAGITSNVIEEEQGLFYVDDAHTRTDKKGRKIIAAQDFVVAHKIKTVFGLGGNIRDNAYFTLIIFNNQDIPEEETKLALLLTSVIADAFEPYIKKGRIFKK
ncbi:MAG: hypothetical protein B6I20_08085 [Bacteroidetes bacterium 4572_117]|nr:MAG: hypothetical protein B6I20_08085 [Bacteroidetes bacterium 4572_117]